MNVETSRCAKQQITHLGKVCTPKEYFNVIDCALSCHWANKENGPTKIRAKFQRVPVNSEPTY